jgi:CAAX protease family protein
LKPTSNQIALRRFFGFATTFSVLAIVFAMVAYGYTRHYALPMQTAAGVYLCFMLLVALTLAPGFPEMRPRIEALLAGRRIPILVSAWCSSYLVYAAGTGDFRWLALAKLLVISVGVAGIYSALPVRDVRHFSVQDACVAVALIGIVLSGQLKGIWNVPVNLDFMGRLFLVSVASWCWVFVRRAPGLGYEFRFSTEVIKQAALNFGYFAAVAIPAGFAMHFTQWNPQWRGIAQFCLDYLEIFLFVALLEELFFRGFLQTLLSKTLGSWLAGQALVSCLFGLFHILHYPFPNWRYVALASIAGWFYGSAFRKGGNLMASALTHAAVDTVWRTWFTASLR